MTAATATKQPKIYGAISVIQSEVGTIPKNGSMNFGTGQGKTAYSFIKNDDILEKITKLLQENNVITKPRILQRIVETRDIGNNRVLPIISVEIEVTYIHTEDGSEFNVGPFWGEGVGNDDKGLRKAVTSAQKIGNLLTFNIATGEPDQDDYYTGNVATPASAPIAVNQTKDEKTISAASSEADRLKKARALAKAAGGNLGLDGAGINKVADELGLDKEYVNSIDDLQKVYNELVKRGKAAQEASA